MRAAERPASRSSTLSIFAFIDAFGWELLRAHPFLDDRLAVRAPVETTFGYSSTCDPTILTGCVPRDHGHFAFFRYDPAASPFGAYGALSLIPRAVASRWRVRRLVSRVAKRSLGYTGYFELYNVPFGLLRYLDYSEKRDLYQPGGINSGAPTVFDQLRAAGTSFHLSDWRQGDAPNIAALEAALSTGAPSFAYLYLAGMDAVLHAKGTRAPEVATKIAWYDAQLRRVLELAEERYESVRLFVFSDHGMTNVGETCDVMSRIARTGLVYGTDYGAVYDSTMARFWFHSPTARARITAALAEESRGRILTDADLAAYGCDFAGNAYGELFFLMHPGVLLCPSFMGARPIAGMHGYAPEHADSTAMFASTVVPDVVPGALADMHDLMLSEAGLLASTAR